MSIESHNLNVYNSHSTALSLWDRAADVNSWYIFILSSLSWNFFIFLWSVPPSIYVETTPTPTFSNWFTLCPYRPSQLLGPITSYRNNVTGGQFQALSIYGPIPGTGINTLYLEGKNVPMTWRCGISHRRRTRGIARSVGKRFPSMLIYNLYRVVGKYLLQCREKLLFRVMVCAQFRSTRIFVEEEWASCF